MHSQNVHRYSGLAYRIYMVSFAQGYGIAVGDWRWWMNHQGWGRCAGANREEGAEGVIGVVGFIGDEDWLIGLIIIFSMSS